MKKPNKMAAVEATETTEKRGPGRPKGSNNKRRKTTAMKSTSKQTLKKSTASLTKRKYKTRAQKAAATRKINTKVQQVVSLKDQLIKKQIQLLQARVNHLHDRLLVVKNDSERSTLLNTLEAVNVQLTDALLT